MDRIWNAIDCVTKIFISSAQWESSLSPVVTAGEIVDGGGGGGGRDNLIVLVG